MKKSTKEKLKRWGKLIKEAYEPTKEAGKKVLRKVAEKRKEYLNEDRKQGGGLGFFR